MNTQSYKTRSAKKGDFHRNWYIIDATNVVLGRMCTEIAVRLRGKHKAIYTPHVDTGDNIIVINAEKVRLLGNKWNDKKYITWSGYPGGQKTKTASEVRAKHPERIIEAAVKGMLPRNKLGRAMYKKLFVYAGSNHPHAAQQPSELTIQSK